MSIIKMTGIETEYGVILEGEKEFNPFEISQTILKNVDRSNCATWFDFKRALSEKKDEEVEVEIVFDKNDMDDLALSNGARLYIDHGHPEFSTAECIHLKELIAFDKAGEIILQRATEAANQKLPNSKKIKLYKNNSDLKGRSYGCHENYLLDASIYEDLFNNKLHKVFLYLVPFFVTRQIFCGAGKVGAENGTEATNYQLSQRADFFESLMGLQTTHNRPIVNTRDEPHAEPTEYRRLHVIVGDANMSEYSTFLKIGTTQIVLNMIEDGFLNENLIVEDPIKAIKDISRDLNFKVKLENGKFLTAGEIQKIYLEKAKNYFEKKDITATQKEVLREWEDVLNKLEEEPMQLNRKIDWVIKKSFLEDRMRKKKISWDNPVTRELSIRYHDISREEGIFYVLQNEGLVERLIDDQAAYQFLTNPPSDSRAYFRGKSIEKFSNQIEGVDWQVIEFTAGHLVILPDPLKMDKNEVGDIIEQSTSVREMLTKCKELQE